nr:hypothetical protein [Larkinella sp. C7]
MPNPSNLVTSTQLLAWLHTVARQVAINRFKSEAVQNLHEGSQGWIIPHLLYNPRRGGLYSHSRLCPHINAAMKLGLFVDRVPANSKGRRYTKLLNCYRNGQYRRDVIQVFRIQGYGLNQSIYLLIAPGCFQDFNFQ